MTNTLTLTSGILTLVGMEQFPSEADIQAFARIFGPSVAPMPPQPVVNRGLPSVEIPCTEAARQAADPDLLASGSEVEVGRHLLEIVAAGLRRPVAEIGDDDQLDGDIEIDSMTAVFVCTVVADVLGPEGMLNLRGNCRPGDLASLGTLARLVCRLRRTVVRQ
jgi:hypothetical protein